MSTGERLLIIDDTPGNINILLENLKADYRIQVATSGAKGLQLAEAFMPDLILLDILMPGMDGFEVLERLKASSRCHDIPVIFLTALDLPLDEERALQSGAVDYISKPFYPPLVKARIHTHLELKKHRDHLAQEVEKRTQELVRARLARQVLENDLRLAYKLQLSMLPPNQADEEEGRGYQVASFLRPARTVGGDLFDYIPLGRDRILFVVGDVSDKGVMAALFLVRVVTLLHWLVPTTLNPAQLLSDLNRALCNDNSACMFVTMGCGLLDFRANSLLYASAGHEDPILLEHGLLPRVLDLSGGPALGLYEEADFPLHQLGFTTRQAILLTSDGVTDAANPVGEVFGQERLLSLLEQVEDRTPSSVIKLCRDAVEVFVDESELADDLTMLAIRPR